jgi:type IX secretion system PorP/SprF family membrane protein
MIKNIGLMKLFWVWCIMLVICTKNTHAQQKFENTMSQYFHNRSLVNPGFTGMDGNSFYVLQNRSWIGFDGAPILTVLSGEINFGKNSAGGAQIYSDQSGIVIRTTGLLNYAYKVKLTDKKQLSLGIGLSISSERLNLSMLNSNITMDPLIAANINGKPSYDGNFGILYTNGNLSMGTTFFRIGENLEKQKLGQADLIVMKGGIFYHFNKNVAEKAQFKPLVMLSLFRDAPLVFDIGSQLIINKFSNAMFVYQSTGNLRFGAGLIIGKIGEINLFYNTNVGKANTYLQQFEMGLNFRFKRDTQNQSQ